MTMTYDAGNRLQTVTQGANVTTVAYDANGNLSTETLSAAVTTYQYDPENRLTGIVNPDATRSTYTYSATGLRRTAQESGGTQTLFIWDGDDYLQERAASTVLYVVQDGEILAEKRSGSRNWYVADPLGSTSLLLDASLNVTDRFEYWPYGEERNHVGTSVTPFRYVGTLGYYRDAAGRLYVRARVLRPAYGRWLTEDPIGFAARDWNLFEYAYVAPATFADPSGRQPPTQAPPVTGGDIESSRKHLCASLGLLSTLRYWRRFADCWRETISVHGPNCSLPNDEKLNCLMQWCREGHIDTVDPYGHCAGGDVCGQTWYLCKGRMPLKPSCTFTICKNVIGQAGCGDYGGDTSIPSIPFVILHEVWHCCGIQHWSELPVYDRTGGAHGGRTGWECPDSLACCAYNAIYDRDYRRCRRHIYPGLPD